jgi:hypothetical protein
MSFILTNNHQENFVVLYSIDLYYTSLVHVRQTKKKGTRT